MQVLETLGHPVTHAYDDLIFTEHMHFLLKFDDAAEKALWFYGHQGQSEDENTGFFVKLSSGLEAAGFMLNEKGTFNMSKNEEQTDAIDIAFFDK